MIGSNIRDRSVLVAAILFVLAVILIGCGGSGGGSGSLSTSATVTGGTTATTGSSTTGGTAGTSLVFKINFPASTRALPPYANSVVISIQRGSDTPITQTINRATKLAYVKTVTFASIPAGTYHVTGQAFLDNDAQGALLATFSANVIVNTGNEVDEPISFTSTVQSVVIDGVPFFMQTGVTTELSGHAVDNLGNIIFLPPGSLTWTITNGATLVDLTSVGFISALAPGSVTVQLTDPGSGASAQATFTITGDALTTTTTGTTGTSDATTTATGTSDTAGTTDATTGSTDSSATTTGTTDATTTGTTDSTTTSTTGSTTTTGTTDTTGTTTTDTTTTGTTGGTTTGGTGVG